jgi:hypothetical protein
VSQVQARQGEPTRRFSLNTGGQRHPWIDAAAAYSVIAGLASFVIGMVNHGHVVGTILGVTGFIIGLFGQMLSATRAERIFMVFGIVASFVGMGLGFAHGGL